MYADRDTNKIAYADCKYPITHFAFRSESFGDANFIITVVRWANVRIRVHVVLVPEDQRGFRSVVQLHDPYDMTRIFNRPWTCAEESAVADTATLVANAYRAMGIVSANTSGWAACGTVQCDPRLR